MKKVILMPIYPDYANKILSGQKRFEYRTQRPAYDISHMVIYATTPLKKIIGVAQVEEIIGGSPSTIWETTKYAAGITRAAYRTYFKGRKIAFAFKLGCVWNVSEATICTLAFPAPQAFSYLDNEIFARIMYQVTETK